MWCWSALKVNIKCTTIAAFASKQSAFLCTQKCSSFGHSNFCCLFKNGRFECFVQFWPLTTTYFCLIVFLIFIVFDALTVPIVLVKCLDAYFQFNCVINKINVNKMSLALVHQYIDFFCFYTCFCSFLYSWWFLLTKKP